MLEILMRGSFDKLERYLDRKLDPKVLMEECGQAGVDALVAATPRDTGLTASSWYYEVKEDEKNGWTVEWKNSNIQNGIAIAYLIQSGHATRSGTYVQGIDYINPALGPVIQQFSAELKKEVRG